MNNASFDQNQATDPRISSSFGEKIGMIKELVDTLMLVHISI